MPLSTREVLLIIRARDEASKVLRGFSSTLAQTSISAAASEAMAAAKAADSQITSIRSIQSASKLSAAEQIYNLQQVDKGNKDAYAAAQRQIQIIRQSQAVENARYTNQIENLSRVKAASKAVADAEAAEAAHALEMNKQVAQSNMARAQSMSSVGIGLAAIGAIGVAAFLSTIKAAKAYDQQAALTSTQTDKVAISLQQIKDMGRSVAASVPIDFNQIQSVLYDIFSSIDTDAPGALKLLQGISQAAVGGQADVGSVAKSTLAILNAYKLKATDVNKVNDIMFQLVRKGVGTYTDFTNAIGRSIPSSVKAGQNLQTLTGMLAFLTRNGLSAANASTSAARALDALSNPKTAINMKQFGISLVDAKGNFLPLLTIIGEMNDKLKGMSQSAKATALSDMFKGSGGTIQAMRFFNLAVTDSNGLLNEMVGDMNDAQGAAAQAYQVMKNTPANQVQLLKNRWDALKTTVGDMMIPVLGGLVKVGNLILGWFDRLSPKMKQYIIYGLAIASITLLIVGAVLAVVGAFAALSAGLALAGTSIGAVLLVIGEVILVLAALAIAAYLIYKNWDQIKKSSIETWNTVYKYVTMVGDYMYQKLKPLINDVTKTFVGMWRQVVPPVVAGAKEIWQAIVGAIDTIRQHMKGFGAAFDGGVQAAKNVFTAFVFFLTWVWAGIKIGLKELVVIFLAVWPVIKDVVILAIKLMANYIGTFIDVLKDVIKLVIDLATGKWSKAWHDFSQIFIDLWNGMVRSLKLFLPGMWKITKDLVDGIWKIAKTLPSLIWNSWWQLNGLMVKLLALLLEIAGKGIAKLATFIFDKFVDLMVWAWKGLVKGAKAVGDWFVALPGWILQFVIKANVWLYQAGVDAMKGMYLGFFFGLGVLTKWGFELPGKIASWGATALTWLLQAGLWVIDGFVNGIVIAAVAIWNWMKALPANLTNWVIGSETWLLAAGSKLIVGMYNGIVAAAKAIWSWLSALPGAIGSRVANASGWLYKTGINIVVGIINGILAQAAILGSWFAGLPARLIGWVGNLKGLLYSAGEHLVQGLINGIVDEGKKLLGEIGNLTGSALNAFEHGFHLGSPSKATYKHGIYLMQGLANGMRAGYRFVRSAINSVTGNVVTTFSSNLTGDGGGGSKPPPGIFPPPGSPGIPNNSGGRNVIFQPGSIVTQEINPAKHAADLGWLIGGRVS